MITGITTVVGDMYLSYYRQVEWRWNQVLSVVHVVTDYETDVVGLRTDAFTRYGAHFNKGAALATALARTNPTGWVLLFDCDVGLRVSENLPDVSELDPTCIYGANRNSNVNKHLPIGFFQLWHTSTGHTIPSQYIHAGSYDMQFYKQWAPDKRKILPLNLQHIGEQRRWWYGPKADRAYMDELLKSSLKTAREQQLDAESAAKMIQDIANEASGHHPVL